MRMHFISKHAPIRHLRKILSPFGRGRSIDEEDRTKDRLWRQVSMTIGIGKVRADGNNVYFQED